jgi:hypothetical protein
MHLRVHGIKPGTPAAAAIIAAATSAMHAESNDNININAQVGHSNTNATTMIGATSMTAGFTNSVMFPDVIEMAAAAAQ